MTTLKKSLYGQSLPVQKRLYNIIFIFGITVGLLGTATCFFLNTPKQALFISIGMTVLFLIFWIAGILKPKYAGNYIICSIAILNFIILPALYLTGGSIDGGISVYVAMGLALTLFFIEEKKGRILCLVEVIYDAIVYYLSYLYRESVYRITELPQGPQFRKFSFWVTGTNVLIATFGVCILSIIVFNLFREEANLVESSMKQLSRLAQTDSLTGLYSRRFLYDYLTSVTAKSKDSFKPFSIILIDIDDFKLVNDAYGHPTGDKVLKELACIIRSCINPGDTASRYGGEEFIIALPEVTQSDAIKKADEIRKKTEEHVFNTETGEKIQLTVSAGIAEYNCSLTVESFIALADRHMYMAKKNGKNRVYGGSSK